MKPFRTILSNLFIINLNWRLSLKFVGSGIIYIFYTPSIKNLLRSLLYKKNKYVFICWGMPSKNSLLKLKIYLLSKSCNFFIFNENITKNKVLDKNKHQFIIIPHLIDVNFFLKEKDSYLNEDYYLVCGDNSRDENLVKSLSLMGVKIYRVTREPKVMKHYVSCNHKVYIYYQISPEKLKELYDKSAAVLVPLLDDIDHCAGQTALLEGVASKKKIICSSGLTSVVAKGFFKIMKVESNDPMIWCSAIKSLDEFISLDDTLCNFNNLNNVNKLYLNYIQENFGANQNFYVE